MDILYPPDYQYSLTYFIIILCLSGIMLYFGHRVEKKNLTGEESYLDRFMMRLTLTLLILGSLYFFALPNYV